LLSKSLSSLSSAILLSPSIIKNLTTPEDKKVVGNWCRRREMKWT
jgi:hypothetical protein